MQGKPNTLGGEENTLSRKGALPIRVHNLWRVCVRLFWCKMSICAFLRRLSRILGLIIQPAGGSEMSRLACVMLLVVLWGDPYLVIHSASGSAATLRQPELQLPQA